MSGANALTLLRAIAGLPILILVAGGERALAIAFFGLAAASDAVDGHLARRSGAAGGHGMLFDPLADKALVLLTLAGLALTGQAPLQVCAIIAVRELFVGAARVLAYRDGLRMHAGVAAKVKTACELAALLLLIAQPTQALADIGAALLTSAALIGILTLPSYLPHTRRRFT